MTEMTKLIDLLRECFTEAEAFSWLTNPHPLLNHQTALDRIADGNIDDVLAVLQAMVDGVYV